MSILQVIVLGILQGLTEFLPISSSAHLALAPWLFGWPDQGLAFDIALHFGTLAAVFLYFIRDWFKIIGEGLGLRPGNRKLLWLLAAATIPVGIAGLIFKKQAEHAWRNPYVIGFMLISVGLFMWWADRRARLTKQVAGVSTFDAMLIGLGQALAVVPGTSRSGITISVGLLRDLDRHAAARFSFLLSMPAILGAAAKDFYDLWKQGGIPPDLRLPFGLGMTVSAITGCLAIGFFLRYVRQRTLALFVFYRVAFGIIVLALAVFFRYGG
jgi:undecaprenyl-diphosphatase